MRIIKKLETILFIISVGLVLISLVLRYSNSPGKYALFAFGIIGIFGVSIFVLVKGWIIKSVNRFELLYWFICALMSFVLYTKYLWLRFGDIPGLFIIPVFVVCILYYFLKSKIKEIKLTTISILYFLLCIPLFGLKLNNGPKQYIPFAWTDKIENHIISESDSLAVLRIGNGDQGTITNVNGYIDFITSEARELYNESQELHALGRYTEAKHKILDAHKLEPNNLEILNQLGLVCKRKEQFEEAEMYFLGAIQLDSNYLMAYNNLGLSYYYAGEFKKGVEILKECEKRVESGIQKHSNLYHLAMNYTGLQECQNAYKYYNELLECCDDHVKKNVFWFIENEAKVKCPNCEYLILEESSD